MLSGSAFVFQKPGTLDEMTICCHSLSFDVTRYTTRYYSLYHLLLLDVTMKRSLDVSLICLFINDPIEVAFRV